MTDKASKGAMTTKEAADELGVSPFIILKAIESGRLVALDIGTGERSHWRIERAELDAFKDRARSKTAARFDGVA